MNIPVFNVLIFLRKLEKTILKLWEIYYYLNEALSKYYSENNDT